ncbi:MAG: hypothetical protein V3T82_08075 [Nitrospinaceae bacterium]
MTNKQPEIFCLWDGKPLINPRSNQTYCNAQCRLDHKQSTRQRNDTPQIQKRQCSECGDDFETENPDKAFCSSKCQQAWNNFWKSQGPRLAKAMLTWRVDRAKGAMTEVCRTFSKARTAHKQRREDRKDSTK